jgi:hypothetical protein
MARTLEYTIILELFFSKEGFAVTQLDIISPAPSYPSGDFMPKLWGSVGRL